MRTRDGAAVGIISTTPQLDSHQFRSQRLQLNEDPGRTGHPAARIQRESPVRCTVCASWEVSLVIAYNHIYNFSTLV
jgi:hypothetical protein